MGVAPSAPVPSRDDDPAPPHSGPHLRLACGGQALTVLSPATALRGRRAVVGCISVNRAARACAMGPACSCKSPHSLPTHHHRGRHLLLPPVPTGLTGRPAACCSWVVCQGWEDVPAAGDGVLRQGHRGQGRAGQVRTHMALLMHCPACRLPHLHACVGACLQIPARPAQRRAPPLAACRGGGGQGRARGRAHRFRQHT